MKIEQNQISSIFKLHLKFHKKRTETPNNRIGLLFKMLASYSIFLFVILVLFFYLYTLGLESARNQYEWKHKSTLMSNVELFEKDLNIMEVYCRQIIQNSTFQALSAMKSSESGFFATGNTLSAIMSVDEYVKPLLPVSEVFCYLPTSDYILAPGLFLPQDAYYETKRYTSSVYETWLKALTLNETSGQFFPLGNLTPPSSQKQHYLYMLHAQNITDLDINAVVCFVFEGENLSSLFSCLDNTSESGSLFVRTETDETILLLSAKEDLDLYNCSIPEIRAFFKDHEIFLDSYVSRTTGLCYYFCYPSYTSTANFARPQILYLALFVAAFLIGIGLIFLLSKQYLRPILALDRELQVINQQRDTLLDENNHLQDVVDTQKPIMRNSYVRLLLKGMIVSEQEASYAKDFLGLIDDTLLYNALYIVAYNNTDTEHSADNTHTLEECNALVMQTLQHYFGETLYCYSPTDRTYALIVTGTSIDKQDLIVQMSGKILQMHEELLDSHGIWLFAGIGKSTDDIVNVWESYQQAIEAVNYTSKNFIFVPYELVKKDSSAFYYPMELSTKLIHFITTGNLPQVLELFNLLHQENIEERSLPINMLQFLLSDIRNTLLKARFALPTNTPKDALCALDQCFNQHVSFKLCEDIALRLCKLFTVESEDSSLISAIEKYIKENYADPSIGLNKISDEFQISESYFSHLFKEKTGVNFSTYLETIRMSEAARLVRDTDIGLNELYLSVGYNNANSFRRAFKKVFGITPSAMREKKN